MKTETWIVIAAGLFGGVVAGLTNGIPGPDPAPPPREAPAPMVRAQAAAYWTRCAPGAESSTAVPGQCLRTRQ